MYNWSCLSFFNDQLGVALTDRHNVDGIEPGVRGKAAIISALQTQSSFLDIVNAIPRGILDDQSAFVFDSVHLPVIITGEADATLSTGASDFLLCFLELYLVGRHLLFLLMEFDLILSYLPSLFKYLLVVAFNKRFSFTPLHIVDCGLCVFVTRDSSQHFSGLQNFSSLGLDTLVQILPLTADPDSLSVEIRLLAISNFLAILAPLLFLGAVCFD